MKKKFAFIKRLMFWTMIAALLLPVVASADSGDSWKIGNYTDEFGDDTGEGYAYIELDGTFSNSATSKSELAAGIIADAQYIFFNLLEYGSHTPTSYVNDGIYTINVKDGDGFVHSFIGGIVEGTGRILLDTRSNKEMRIILDAGGVIKFSISNGGSKYNFTINNATNFYEQFGKATFTRTNWVDGIRDGMMIVQSHWKYGVLNTSLDVVIPIEYDEINRCDDGLFVVEKDNKYGVIDTSLSVVAPIKYDYISKFGYADGIFYVKLDGKYGYIGKDGQPITELKYTDCRSFSCGRAAVEIDDKWGYIDIYGNEVIPCQYKSAGSYSEGFAWVTGREGYGQKEYLIDLDGNVICGGYDIAYEFSNGLAAVESDDKWGYINTSGEVVIPFQWDGASWFDSENGTASVSLDGEWYRIDSDGNIVDVDISYPYVDGLAITEIDGRYGYVNEEGEIVIPCEFDYATSFSDGYALVERDEDELGWGKWGIIDTTGSFVDDNEWDDVRSFREYLRVYRKMGIYPNGFYGLMDWQGNMVLDCIYQSIAYGEGYYAASTDSEWILFDEEFNIVQRAKV